MDKRLAGLTKQMKGSIKEAIGMIIGDPVVQAEGAAEKKAGQQEADRAQDPPANDPAD